jgi:hypothetical protein
MDIAIKLATSPFANFDWALLESPDFGEDAVREELIAPLLWTLGYQASPPNRIVRSKRLQHPFVAIGTTQRRISLVPDYLMHVGERPAWILDAKSPREDVVDPAHEAQAYSYVCHRDVRAEWYAVCNGREFAAFHVADMAREPRLRFPLRQLAEHWGKFWNLLAPEQIHKVESKYLKDFGIHMLKLGAARDAEFTFPFFPIPMIGRVGEDLFSTHAQITLDETTYFITLDFDRARLQELLPLVPQNVAEHATKSFGRPPSIIKLQGYTPRVVVTTRLSAEILENDREHYLPLEVVKFEPSP